MTPDRVINGLGVILPSLLFGVVLASPILPFDIKRELIKFIAGPSAVVMNVKITGSNLVVEKLDDGSKGYFLDNVVITPGPIDVYGETLFPKGFTVSGTPLPVELPSSERQ